MDRALLLQDIESGLRKLGLKAGMYLEVHSALSSFGQVDGGAQTVVTALKNIITDQGAIIMPAFTLSKEQLLSDKDKKIGILKKLKVLPENTSETTGMGAIADAFRAGADVIVGEGRHRVAAWGAEQELNVQGFGNLHKRNGHALLIGVDIYRLSSMHYVECSLPEDIKQRFKPSDDILKTYPDDQWFVETYKPPIKAWYTIQNRAIEQNYINERKIGKAKCMFFEVNKVINLYKEALETDPYGLYGLEPSVEA